MGNEIINLILIIAGIGNTLCESEPPPHDQVAKTARYIVANTDWVSVATISTRNDTKGYPFVSLKSMSDGPKTNSTGIPYLYMTDLDVSGQDIEVDPRSTLLASLAETDYCKEKRYDPQDPRCAKIFLTGRIVKIDQSSPEYEFGKNALFSKHPAMKTWPSGHGFYVSKLQIEQIGVLNFFGGMKHVTLEDYLNAESANRIEVIEV